MPWWIGHGSPTRGVEVAADHGFDAIEISLENPWPDTLDADALAEAAQAVDVELGFHGPWRGQSVGHPRPELARAALAVADRCLAFAEAAGGDYLVLHVDPRDHGGYPDADVVEQGVRHAIEALAELADAAGTVEVVVENTWPPTGTPDELSRILDAVPGVGFCFDPGHARMSAVDDPEVAEPGTWVEAVGDRFSLLHLMDYVVVDERVHDHLVPGLGEAPVEAFLDAARKAGCERCVIEAFEGEDGPAEPGELGRARQDLAEV